MARYSPTDTFGAFSGSVGSITYSKNKGGYYRKLKPQPTNPSTIYQNATRVLLGALSSFWRALTDTQRQSWINAAVNFPYTHPGSGDTYFLDGKGLFIALNANLFNSGQVFLFTAPIPAFNVSFDSLSATVDTVTGVDLSFTTFPGNPVIDINTVAIIRATIGFSAGSYNFKDRLRIVTTFVGGTTSPQDITAAYILRLGTVPAPGARVGFGAYVINASGESTVELRASTIST